MYSKRVRTKKTFDQFIVDENFLQNLSIEDYEEVDDDTNNDSCFVCGIEAK